MLGLSQFDRFGDDGFHELCVVGRQGEVVPDRVGDPGEKCDRRRPDGGVAPQFPAYSSAAC